MNKESNKTHAEEIITEYQPILKNFIRKRVSNKEDAEDILQDVFFQLVKGLENTLNPIEQLAAWLYRVTRNTIINKGKKMQEYELPGDTYKDKEEDNMLSELSEVLFTDSTSPTPETEYMRTLVWEELEAALSELPPEQREVFELTELDGLSVKEISKLTGTAVNTLLSRKHYAVKFLRKRLSSLYNDIIHY